MTGGGEFLWGTEARPITPAVRCAFCDGAYVVIQAEVAPPGAASPQMLLHTMPSCPTYDEIECPADFMEVARLKRDGDRSWAARLLEVLAEQRKAKARA